MSRGFYVLEFTDEKSVETVYSDWISPSKTKVQFPPKKRHNQCLKRHKTSSCLMINGNLILAKFSLDLLVSYFFLKNKILINQILDDVKDANVSRNDRIYGDTSDIESRKRVKKIKKEHNSEKPRYNFNEAFKTQVNSSQLPSTSLANIDIEPFAYSTSDLADISLTNGNFFSVAAQSS